MKKITMLLIMCLILSSVTGCSQGAAVRDTSGQTELEGTQTAQPQAPPGLSFTAMDMEGEAVTAELFSNSSLTMVNVWATYCNPCLSEMPGLGELAGEYDEAEFPIVGILSDVTESSDESERELAEELIRETGAAYRHLLLNESLYQALLTDVTAVPTTFFVDSGGEILATYVGSRDKDSWKEIIDGYLEKM